MSFWTIGLFYFWLLTLVELAYYGSIFNLIASLAIAVGLAWSYDTDREQRKEKSNE